MSIRATLDKSLKWLAEQTGLTIMDGRARRKQLDIPNRPQMSQIQEMELRIDKQSDVKGPGGSDDDPGAHRRLCASCAMV